MSSDTAISIANVSKRYEMYAQPRDRLLQFFSFGQREYFKEFWALRDVSFSVAKGETIGILGRNGSGKSTLLQIIAGTLEPTTGSVQSNGVLAALLELGSGFNPEFTGRENVYLNGSILGLSQEEMDRRFDDIAAFADIGIHLDQPVKTYSSGMGVRLAFAVQACIQPDILIVDEALSVGDEKFQRKCFDYIDGLRENGCSILLVTHSTATVEKFCQRGVLLHKGAVHGVGPAKEIVDQYHALLYSDERSYLRYVNQRIQQSSESGLQAAEVAAVSEQSTTTRSELAVEEQQKSSGEMRAVIKSWSVCSTKGEHCEVFHSGERAVISFDVDVWQPVSEMQAGILIRTIEGVSAFGTSTLYHKANASNSSPGSTVRFEFVLDLNLCQGSFFVTLAIAEAISHSDMRYLDRKTDVILLKINQNRITGSGIALLNAQVRSQVVEQAL